VRYWVLTWQGFHSMIDCDLLEIIYSHLFCCSHWSLALASIHPLVQQMQMKLHSWKCALVSYSCFKLTKNLISVGIISKYTFLHSTVFKLPLYSVAQANVCKWCVAVDRLSNAAGCEGQMIIIIMFVFVANEVQCNVRVLALANKYPSALNCLSGMK